MPMQVVIFVESSGPEGEGPRSSGTNTTAPSGVRRMNAVPRSLLGDGWDMGKRRLSSGMSHVNNVWPV